MRISLIEPKENNELISRANVFLDGVGVERCVCADDTEGIVVVRRSELPLLSPDFSAWKPSCLSTQHGKVQILFDVEECPGGWYGRSTPETQYPDVHIPRPRTPEQIALEQDEHGIPLYNAFPREDQWKK